MLVSGLPPALSVHMQSTLPGFPADKSTGFVYFGARNGHIKIGYSQWPERRAKQLRLSLLRVEPGTRADERRLHQRFKHLRQDREWFEAGADLLTYIVRGDDGGAVVYRRPA